MSAKDSETIKWAKYSGLRLMRNCRKDMRIAKTRGYNTDYLRYLSDGARFVLESLYGLSEARKRVAERGLTK